MTSEREQAIREFEGYYEKLCKKEERELRKLRRKNLEKIRDCRDKLEKRRLARHRAFKLSKLDKIEGYVERMAFMPRSYKRMVKTWASMGGRPRGEIELDIYDDFLI